MTYSIYRHIIDDFTLWVVTDELFLQQDGMGMCNSAGSCAL